MTKRPNQLDELSRQKAFLDHIVYTGTLQELNGKHFVENETRPVHVFLADGFFESIQSLISKAQTEQLKWVDSLTNDIALRENIEQRLGELERQDK